MHTPGTLKRNIVFAINSPNGRSECIDGLLHVSLGASAVAERICEVVMIVRVM